MEVYTRARPREPRHHVTSVPALDSDSKNEKRGSWLKYQGAHGQSGTDCPDTDEPQRHRFGRRGNVAQRYQLPRRTHEEPATFRRKFPGWLDRQPGSKHGEIRTAAIKHKTIGVTKESEQGTERSNRIESFAWRDAKTRSIAPPSEAVTLRLGLCLDNQFHLCPCAPWYLSHDPRFFVLLSLSTPGRMSRDAVALAGARGKHSITPITAVTLITILIYVKYDYRTYRW